MSLTDLSEQDRRIVEELFESRIAAGQVGGDGFQLQITRSLASGSQTMTVPESLVPRALLACLKDELV